LAGTATYVSLSGLTSLRNPCSSVSGRACNMRPAALIATGHIRQAFTGGFGVDIAMKNALVRLSQTSPYEFQASVASLFALVCYYIGKIWIPHENLRQIYIFSLMSVSFISEPIHVQVDSTAMSLTSTPFKCCLREGQEEYLTFTVANTLDGERGTVWDTFLTVLRLIMYLVRPYCSACHCRLGSV
jgi:hypothetical protein